MTPRIGVAGILVDDKRRVLLGQRGKAPNQGLWAFPGGHLEYGESIEGALQREFREETGLHIRVGPLLYVAELIAHDFHYVLLDYAVERVSGEMCAGDDLEAVEWVDPTKVAGRGLAAAMVDCLRSAAVRRYIDESRQ